MELEQNPSAQIEAREAIRVGLLGQGIQKSRTPGMHRAEGAAQGLNLTYDLLDTDVMPDGDMPLVDRVAHIEAAGYAGINVTFPYKQAIIPYLDEISDAAKKVGAVNTVVFRDGKRFGHNTDYSGFAEGLKRGLPDADLSAVMLLGAGGAGGAVAHALIGSGVQRLYVTDRDSEQSARLVRALNEAQPDSAVAISSPDVAAQQVAGIVNATPMGMAKLPGMAIEADLIRADQWVADIVYFPLETELLRTARAKGCRTLSGAGMAVFQAVRAFELFTGRKPDANRMQATFEAFSEPTAA